MNIYVCGINYKAAPLEVREKFSFSSSEQKEALEKIRMNRGADECLLLSTCNRTELYIYSAAGGFKRNDMEELVCRLKGLDIREYRKYFYSYSGIKAVRHIFKVTCGLESMVLGEDQILGQVKSAHETARKTGATSVVLNTLFRDVVTAAKKVKTNTALSKKPVSIASLAVQFISAQFEGLLENKTALVVGAGEIGTIAMKNLVSKGIGKVYVTTRSHGKASHYADRFGNVSQVNYRDRYLFMDEADIVISCTSSPHYTITADMLEKSLYHDKKRVFADLAVPRDIDCGIAGIQGIEYYNIDDLKAASDRNTRKRLEESLKAETITEEFIEGFERWYEFRNVLPTVIRIQDETHRIADEKINRTISRLKFASDEDKDIVRQAMKNIVDCMMNRFVYRIRENGSKEDIGAYFRCLNEVMKEVDW
jgi:glutamyl-tRNA reductase